MKTILNVCLLALLFTSCSTAQWHVKDHENKSGVIGLNAKKTGAGLAYDDALEMAAEYCGEKGYTITKEVYASSFEGSTTTDPGSSLTYAIKTGTDRYYLVHFKCKK